MLTIDKYGVVVNARIRLALRPALEHARMVHIHGIIVHQTDSASVESTLSQYTKAGSNGAHFLIDKDGTIFQTASVYKRTSHVGLLKSRCIVEHTCPSTELKSVRSLSLKALSVHESKKSWPDRYPSNSDALGIELVGKFIESKDSYESLTKEQNESLKWLVAALAETLNVPLREVFRHPDVSYKTVSEAGSAQWK